MDAYGLSKDAAPVKSGISLSSQLQAVDLMRGADFHRAFPTMRTSEAEWTKRALDAAAKTLAVLGGQP
jgi:hypothetical protein